MVNISNLDEFIREVISMISPGKFSDGGAAMFEDNRRNHHNLIEGAKVIIPLLRLMFRDWIRS